MLHVLSLINLSRGAMEARAVTDLELFLAG